MKFVPNKSFEIEADKLPGVVRQRQQAASAIVRTAKSIAPRESNRYRDSLKTLRLGTRVFAKTGLYYAHLIEFGGGNHQPQAPLRRGALAHGLRIDESKKV